MKKVMTALSESIGVRFGGTEGEHRAAEWLTQAFAEEGLPVHKQRYGFIGWGVSESPTVSFLEPEERSFATAPVIYSASTPPDGVVGRVIRHGKKHLIAGLYELDCYRVVSEEGQTLAQLIVEPSGPAIPLLNPEPVFRIPQIVIGKDAQEYIENHIEGRLIVNARIRTELDPDAVAYNVIATYSGAPQSPERIVVIAHYDTQLGTPGCYDNASGVAGLFGLLREVRNARLPINIDFVAVASEEIGMHGSRYLVMDLKERDELRFVKACICLDQISGGDTLWIWAGPDEFRREVVSSVKESGLTELGPLRVDDPMPGCDMWPFYTEGVPGCLYMWWRPPHYHRPDDTLDKVEFEKVESTVNAAYRLIVDLAETSPTQDDLATSA